jgi:hypothetical protein
LTAPDPSAFDGAAPDTLEEATEQLRRASRVPYEAQGPGRWLREFQHHVSMARRLLAARSIDLRHDSTEGPPRLGPLAERRRQCHEQLARAADDLFASAYISVQPDLLEMVELTEAAKALEHALRRERERRSDLLFEATHRDLGGG